MYKRPGRRGWYGFFTSTDKHVSLGEDDDRARDRFAECLKQRGFHAATQPVKQAPWAALFALTWERAKVNNTKKTAYEIHVKLDNVLRWLEERNSAHAGELTIALVEAYKADRRERWSARSVNRYLHAWKRAQKHAVELGAAPKESLLCFIPLREPRHVPHQASPTRSQLTRVIKAVKDARYRALFRMVLGTGMRDDEARHLEASDVTKTAITITPKKDWTTKNYRYRKIPISVATYKAASAFIKARASLGTLDQKTTWKHLDRACREAGVVHLSMHDLRRAYATALHDDGVKISQISKLLGHGDPLTTTRYLRVTEDTEIDRKRLPW